MHVAPQNDDFLGIPILFHSLIESAKEYPTQAPPLRPVLLIRPMVPGGPKEPSQVICRGQRDVDHGDAAYNKQNPVVLGLFCKPFRDIVPLLGAQEGTLVRAAGQVPMTPEI